MKTFISIDQVINVYRDKTRAYEVSLLLTLSDSWWLEMTEHREYACTGLFPLWKWKNKQTVRNRRSKTWIGESEVEQTCDHWQDPQCYKCSMRVSRLNIQPMSTHRSLNTLYWVKIDKIESILSHEAPVAAFTQFGPAHSILTQYSILQTPYLRYHVKKQS
jgi:hypothetical protein